MRRSSESSHHHVARMASLTWTGGNLIPLVQSPPPPRSSNRTPRRPARTAKSGISLEWTHYHNQTPRIPRKQLASMSIVRSVLSLGRLAARRSPVVRLSTRQLHRSTPSFASEIPRDPLADPKLRALQDKLGQNPAALEAIKDLGQLMISKGLLPRE